MSDPKTSFFPCCKDMAIAQSFPARRHFFINAGVLKLTVAKTILSDRREAVLERPIDFCPFCGKPSPGRFPKLRQTKLPGLLALLIRFWRNAGFYARFGSIKRGVLAIGGGARHSLSSPVTLIWRLP
jgi:hypothetical protein